MATKNVHIKLVPILGTLTRLTATVEGALAVATKGSKAEATVRAKRTDVEIEANGTPQATFMCNIVADYDDGRQQIICAQVQALDANGSYSQVFHIVALPPPPTAAAAG
jgi:flagellar basal body-associated protein FliL